MTIPTAELKSALKTLAPLAVSRTLNPILLDVHGGKLEIAASSGSEWSRFALELDVKIKPCCVPASHFALAVNNAGAELSLSQGNGTLIIESSSRMTLRTTIAEDFPGEPTPVGKPIGMETKDLAEVARLVSWMPRDDSGNKYIHAETAKIDFGNTVSATATNRYILAWAEKASISGDGTLLMPMAHISRFCDALERDGAQLFVSENYAKVKHKTGVHYYKLMEGQWPDVAPMKQGFEKIGEIEAAELAAHADVCNSISSQGERVTLESNGDGLVLSLQGQAEYVSPKIGSVGKMRISLFPERMMQTIRQFSGKVAVYSGERALKFSDGRLSVMTAGLADK